MKKLLVTLLVGWVGGGSAGAQSRVPRPYALTWKPASQSQYGRVRDIQVVSLQDTRRKRVLWTRRVDTGRMQWAEGGRALTAETEDGGLLGWREGEEPRHLMVPGARKAVKVALWSPDKGHLLIRVGAPGMQPTSLFCLRLGRGQESRLSLVSRQVNEMKWRGNRSVLFRGYNEKRGKWLPWKVQRVG